MLFLQTLPDETVSSVLDKIETSDVLTTDVQASNIQVNIPDHLVTINTVETPLPVSGIEALAGWLDIPKAWLMRQRPEFQQTVLDYTLGHSGAQGAALYSPTSGLQAVVENVARIIPASSLVRVASRVIDPAAIVTHFTNTASDFRLDVIAPNDFERGIGGDRRVGDLTHAGVRFTQDRKANLAPAVEPFEFRLLCTNGWIESVDGLKVDARGSSVDEVLAEFEAIADLAFRRAEQGIEAFYDLRTQHLDNPERTLLRIANENGIAPRTITRLLERVPIAVEEATTQGRQVSMFDIVNLLTNEANRPGTREGLSLGLQRAGGAVVTDHVERCSHCQSRLATA